MKKNKLPEHIAIIMDGNGRWAKQRGLSRIEGHKEGVNSVKKIISFCSELKINHLTLFTFSEENWSRPTTEVLSLMKLLVKSLKNELESLIKNNIRMSVIGDINKLDPYTRKKLNDAIKLTNINNGLNLNLAISYGSRQEIVRAINKILIEKKNSINIEEFSKYLYTKDMPNPDLLIRTGKENRISNFLLWQIPYTEIFFSRLYWPDFNEKEMEKILIDFNNRERRYGSLVD